MAAEAAQTRICRDCDEVFELSESEVAFYVQRDLSLPRRCLPCRIARRPQREAERQVEAARGL